MKHLFNRKFIMFISCFALIFVCTGIGAYYMDGDGASNKITIGSNAIELVEDFQAPPKLYPGVSFTKDVKAKNIASVDCFVRIKAVYSNSDMGQYCTIDWNTEDWVYNSEDAYWYYTKAISKGETTTSLFTTITISEDAPPAAIKDFDVLVYAESYQAKGYEDYLEAWGKDGYQMNNKDVLGPSIMIGSSSGLSEGAPLSTNKSNYTLSLDVRDASGVKSVKANDAEMTLKENGKWECDLTLADNTVTEVTITAADKIGNANTATYYLYCDSVPPALSITSEISEDKDNPTETGNEVFTITGTVSDEGGIKDLTVNEVKVTVNDDNTWTADVPLTEDETKIIEVKATDNAGNTTSQTRYVNHTKLTYTVTNNLTNVTSSNSVDSAKENSRYEAKLEANDGFTIESVSVTMGDEDITSSAYSNGEINIDQVTGNIVINAVARELNAYVISNQLTNVTSNNPNTSILEGESYTVTLTPKDGYLLNNVAVTMDGADITADVYDGETNTIKIERVTGDVTISASLKYTSVNYIGSNGTQYIDLGVSLTADMAIEVDASFDKNTNGWYMGTIVKSGSTYKRAHFGIMGSSLDINAQLKHAFDTDKHRYYLSSTTISIDDVTGTSNTEFPVGTNFYLFDRNKNGDTYTQQMNSAKVYRVAIYENNVLTREFVPVVRFEDNTPGLYDLITGEFVVNSGTGTFTTG